MYPFFLELLYGNKINLLFNGAATENVFVNIEKLSDL
jgi:hypothetical protein